jgi:hypothetical protein
VWHDYSGQVGKQLRAVPPGAFYDHLFPSSTNRLMAYANSSARVGKIDNELIAAGNDQRQAEAPGYSFSQGYTVPF